MMDKPVVELSEVSVKKQKSVLLDCINLSVSKNEFIGVIGPNGAGKTSLLNVIAGFEKFHGGLRLFEREESWMRSREVRMRVGYVPQSLEIDPSFPILAMEAVMIGSYGRTGLFRSPGGSEYGRALELMELMRVAHLANRPLGHLSGGERQKISLARAILQRPEILLLDEPTANLDIAIQKEVLDLIENIYERESLTVLYVTHDFNMLPESMRRAVFLNHGKIVFDGGIQSALTGTMLSRLFEYPLETFERNGRRFVSFG
jgi:ABC-type Mn2+/Zn2+ transport system ATPase subunit